MGNAAAHCFPSNAAQQAADPRERLQEDLPKLVLVERLSNGKFIKSYRCKVDGLSVVVKVSLLKPKQESARRVLIEGAICPCCVPLQVYVKRDPDEDLRPVEAELARIAAALPPDQHPYALPYQVCQNCKHVLQCRLKRKHARHIHTDNLYSSLHLLVLCTVALDAVAEDSCSSTYSGSACILDQAACDS
jgi:hypothetical protein